VKILITGATGFIGWHLQHRLQACGHQLVACVRNSQRPYPTLKGVELIEADFTRDHTPDDWRARLQGIEVVINGVGIIRETAGQSFDALHYQAPTALFQACAQTGVKRVVQISALGADAGAETAYHLSKRAADEYLMDLDINWYVVRPSIVYGQQGASFNLFSALAALPCALLPAGGQQLIQPIHIDDLTWAVVQCVEGQAPSRRVINAVGPEPLSLHGFLQKLRHRLGLGQLRTISLPYAAFTPLAAVGPFLKASILSRDSLRMLRRGNYADVQPFIETFGFAPRPVEEALSPATEAEVWHAKLYFLRPLLIVSIALTWISAGLVSAFFYPTAESYQLLAALGAPNGLQPLLLYGAAGLNCVLGLAMLSTRWLKWAAYLQMTVMLTYTALITAFLPEYWLHPFGPVVKNFPLLAATLVLLAMERRP